MTVGDYGNLAATETSFGKPNMLLQHKQWLDAIKPTLATLMWAVRDALPVSGHFPRRHLCSQLLCVVVGEC